jgi:hypothetical protein
MRARIVYWLYLLTSLLMALQSAGAQMHSAQSIVTDIPFQFMAKETAQTFEPRLVVMNFPPR